MMRTMEYDQHLAVGCEVTPHRICARNMRTNKVGCFIDENRYMCNRWFVAGSGNQRREVVLPHEAEQSAPIIFRELLRCVDQDASRSSKSLRNASRSGVLDISPATRIVFTRYAPRSNLFLESAERAASSHQEKSMRTFHADKRLFH